MKVIDNYRITRVQFENILIDMTRLNKLHLNSTVKQTFQGRHATRNEAEGGC